jgi:hypothetical protein
VASVRADIQPSTLIIGNFRKPRQTSQKPAELPGNVYFAIALTTLNAETGILNYFPRDSNGIHLAQAEILQPGDGIICRGEDGNPNGGGEGGIVLMIRYRAETDRSRD